MSANLERVVKLACKPKAAAPKSKYLDPIIAATYAEDGTLAELCRALAPRLRDPSYVVVFKALIVLHTMIRTGHTDNVLSFLSESGSDILRLRHLLNGERNAHSMPENVSNYAQYLDTRIRAYRDLKHDSIRVQSENNRDHRATSTTERTGASRSKTVMGRKLRVMTVEKGLLRETKVVQRQIDALLECKFFLDNLEDELTLTALRLLVKDMLILFQAGNEGVINVLEHFFEMSHVDGETALTIYKSFCVQTEHVVEYLSIARKLSNLLNVPVPNLRHAPVKLTGALEEYLHDPNFEQNRIEYKTNKALADGKIPNKAKSQPAAQTESRPATDPAPSSSSQAPAPARAVSATPAKTEPVDFFHSIEETQPTMFNPQTNSPNTSWFHQNAGYNPFRQQGMAPQMTGMPFGQPLMNAQPTGFPASSPFIQPQATAMPFMVPQATGASPFLQAPGMAQMNLQPQPQGLLQPQLTGSNPFRQSMLFPQATGQPFTNTAGSQGFNHPAFQQPSAASTPGNELQRPQFAAALINRPASTPITSNNVGLKPVVSHQTGSRNPFGQPKAATPPPVPKPPTLAELSTGYSGWQTQPTTNGATNAAAQNIGNNNNGNSGGGNNNMSSIASSFALNPPSSNSPFSYVTSTPTGLTASHLTAQTTSTSAFSDAFSTFSSGTTGTSATTNSAFSTPVSPLQSQATGLAGLKPFKPTSSFGASLLESVPGSRPVTPSGNNVSPGAQQTGSNAPSMSLSPNTAYGAASPLTSQPTGLKTFTPTSAFGTSLAGGLGAGGGNSTLGVGLRPQLTGAGAANPFRASMMATPTSFSGSGVSSMPTGISGLQSFQPTGNAGGGMGASLFHGSSAGSSAFRPTLPTIQSFGGAQDQQQQKLQNASLI